MLIFSECHIVTAAARRFGRELLLSYFPFAVQNTQQFFPEPTTVQKTTER